jgi:GLPGLI family protein
MKTNKILFLFLFNIIFSFGQNSIIEYKISPNTNSEAFSGLLLSISKSELESNFKLVTLSLIYNQEEMKFYISKTSSIVNDDFDTSLLMTNLQGIYYRKNKSNELYIEIEENRFKENYIIKKKLITDWKLTDEKKMICGYECFKATCTLKVDYGDNDINTLYPIIVWYCPQIKTSYGPKGYGNLPGMILEVEENFVIYSATKIEFDKSNLTIALPTNKKIITESKMYDLMEEKFSSDLNKCQSDKKKEEINKAKDDKI